MRVAIITYCRREDGHPGGVPKWAWYLKRALQDAGWEATHYTWRDYPRWRERDGQPEQVKAQVLSSHLARKWELGPRFDHIIADGFWACGMPDDARVTAVCHGTWAGLAASCGGVDAELIAAQGEAYRRFPVVAVSEAAARQVECYHGVRVAAVIPNGVDLEIFRPAQRGPNDPPVVVYAGRGFAKGEDVVREVRAQRDAPLQGIVEYLDAAMGMEARAYQRGDVLLHPSRHEGDSYAVKEAAACGLPVVASAVGALRDNGSAEIGEVVDGFEARDYCAVLEHVLANGEQYRPRQWAEKHAGFGEFAHRWREHLAGRGFGQEASSCPTIFPAGLAERL
jgi:glycosyltransferase involved in cell wall biosynthesis